MWQTQVCSRELLFRCRQQAQLAANAWSDARVGMCHQSVFNRAFAVVLPTLFVHFVFDRIFFPTSTSHLCFSTGNVLHSLSDLRTEADMVRTVVVCLLLGVASFHSFLFHRAKCDTN